MMLLTQTIVSEGHCARTCCSDVDSHALVGAGADSAEFVGSVVGVVGCRQGSNEPDWGAEPAAGAAGAKTASRWLGRGQPGTAILHELQLDQVLPVPATFAVCHSAPHCFMMLSASAVLADAEASMIVATPVNRINETRVM